MRTITGDIMEQDGIICGLSGRTVDRMQLTSRILKRIPDFFDLCSHRKRLFGTATVINRNGLTIAVLHAIQGNELIVDALENALCDLSAQIDPSRRLYFPVGLGYQLPASSYRRALALVHKYFPDACLVATSKAAKKNRPRYATTRTR